MKKGLLICGGIGLLAFAGFVVNEVRKEYDKNVNDYNELLAKAKDMSDLIDK